MPAHANREPLVIVCTPPNADDSFAFLGRSAHGVAAFFADIESSCSLIEEEAHDAEATLQADETPKIDR